MQQERAASLRAGKAPELQEGRPDDDCGTEWTGVLWCSMLVAGADGLSSGLVWSQLVSTGLALLPVRTLYLPVGPRVCLVRSTTYVLTSTSSLVAWQSSTGRTGALYVHVCTPACTEY